MVASVKNHQKKTKVTNGLNFTILVSRGFDVSFHQSPRYREVLEVPKCWTSAGSRKWTSPVDKTLAVLFLPTKYDKIWQRFMRLVPPPMYRASFQFYFFGWMTPPWKLHVESPKTGGLGRRPPFRGSTSNGVSFFWCDDRKVGGDSRGFGVFALKIVCFAIQIVFCGWSRSY